MKFPLLSVATLFLVLLVFGSALPAPPLDPAANRDNYREATAGHGTNSIGQRKKRRCTVIYKNPHTGEESVAGEGSHKKHHHIACERAWLTANVKMTSAQNANKVRHQAHLVAEEAFNTRVVRLQQLAQRISNSALRDHFTKVLDDAKEPASLDVVEQNIISTIVKMEDIDARREKENETAAVSNESEGEEDVPHNSIKTHLQGVVCSMQMYIRGLRVYTLALAALAWFGIRAKGFIGRCRARIAATPETTPSRAEATP